MSKLFKYTYAKFVETKSSRNNLRQQAINNVVPCVFVIEKP